MEGREGRSIRSIDHAQPTPPNQRMLQPIERARLQLEQEGKEIAAEERALDTFGERVEAIDCEGIQFSSGIDQIREIDGESKPMTKIQTAYRETMLDVDHYDREYGEPLVTHLASEIGLDLATGICGEANVAFTPQLKTALLNGIEQAGDKRRAFKEVLDEETASLASARQALTGLLEEVNEWHSSTPRTDPEITPSFDDIERELDTIVTERQDHLHHCSELQHLTNRDLCGYLYTGDDWTYPVLTAAASLRNEIEQPSRQNIEQH